MHRISSHVVALALGTLAYACGSPTESSLRGDKNATNPSASTKFGDANAAAAGGCVQDPSFYDVPGDNCDNDGDGTVDNPPSCDDAEGGTADDFAKTMGICARASEKGYGLVSASFTRGHNNTEEPDAEQHNTLPKFGDVITPREGKRLGVLSTGFAQEFNSGQRAFSRSKVWSSSGALPPGFPKAAAGCPQSSIVQDVIGVKLELKAPMNATGIKFDFNFHSSEWPEFICTKFNDGFIAFLDAKGFNGGTPDNISFDAKNNPVSVNNGFFDRCTPNTTMGCEGDKETTSICAGGPGELAGTGFGLEASACGGGMATQGGATGWLTSQAPVTPGETFTLHFIIWDTGDGDLDSTVLLDKFQWIGGAVTTATARPDGLK